eukprot:CAMPEP_0119132998 /NCGR_PEP_ID=MMETSP1310-20130426/12761_1 /TAXON_ID=464262 /ORGANISM="Genus nov. species nov., Strain RCC2339" /LENGTH=326 /DNA_ID=CAMNT_0007123667 /DNA_START=108 /DNA_END=1084 /DNA_ORIENTATION=+
MSDAVSVCGYGALLVSGARCVVRGAWFDASLSWDRPKWGRFSAASGFVLALAVLAALLPAVALALVAHRAEGPQLRRLVLVRDVQVQVLPGVALRAPLEEHLAGERLQAEEVTVVVLRLLGGRAVQVEPQHRALAVPPPVLNAAQPVPEHVVRAEPGVVVVPQLLAVLGHAAHGLAARPLALREPPGVRAVVCGLHELGPEADDAALLLVADALHPLELPLLAVRREPLDALEDLVHKHRHAVLGEVQDGEGGTAVAAEVRDVSTTFHMSFSLGLSSRTLSVYAAWDWSTPLGAATSLGRACCPAPLRAAEGWGRAEAAGASAAAA